MRLWNYLIQPPTHLPEAEMETAHVVYASPLLPMSSKPESILLPNNNKNKYKFFQLCL